MVLAKGEATTLAPGGGGIPAATGAAAGVAEEELLAGTADLTLEREPAAFPNLPPFFFSSFAGAGAAAAGAGAGAAGRQGNRTGKIQNFNDMQAAIKEADKRKQNARMKAVEGQVERKERENNRVVSTAYKRKTRRQTMRQNEFKVTSQLEGFLASMKNLEEEFERLGKELQEKEEALSRQIALTEKSEQQVDLLANVLQKTSDNMEKMSEDLKTMVSTAPGKEGSPFQTSLKSFNEKFQGMQRDMIVQVTKSEVESKMIAEHTVQLLEEAGIPPPPPPPAPAPAFTSSPSFDQLNREKKGSRLGMRSASTTNLNQDAPKAAPVTSLLASIRQGKELRKLDQEQVKKEREDSKKRWGQTVNMFASLQDTLLGAMEERRQAMDEDSDDDEDELDDWGDDDDDYLSL
mmetsp:Transcript_16779/g.26101  ORF Transcript_16779/g.26101 Transcript_16779/m.26101 type:complete len:405 (-) Transcript_16779:127-1341(-)